MAVVVRRPVLADVGRLAVVNLETWRHAYRDLMPEEHLASRQVEEYERRWRRNLTEAPPEVRFWVAAVDGEVAGYAIGGPYRPQDDADPDEATSRWGELYALSTHPRHQRRGAGTALHDAILAQLRDDGYGEAALWVLDENTTARRWYGARGWRPDGATAAWSGAGVPLREVRLRRSLP